MHIVTGMIIAALAGRVKKRSDLQGLPYQNTGPLQIAHVLPGRIRLRIPALQEQNDRVLSGINQLSSLKGIDQLSTNSVTGSLVIRFDQQTLDPVFLFSVVARLLGFEEQLEKPVNPIILREFNEMSGSLNRAVYDETHGIIDLRTLAVAILLILGGRQLIRDRWGALPTGVTLIWWAFNLMRYKKGID
jgi:hypothetical protein